MTIALLIARLLLAIVFAVAGAAKLADLVGSRRALEEFGLPRPLANPAGTILPLMEIAIATALIPVASGWWGAVAALALPRRLHRRDRLHLDRWPAARLPLLRADLFGSNRLGHSGCAMAS
jgi:hypothetical protein